MLYEHLNIYIYISKINSFKHVDLLSSLHNVLNTGDYGALGLISALFEVIHSFRK